MSPLKSQDVFDRGFEFVRRAGILSVWVYALLGLASVAHLATLLTARTGFRWHGLDLAYGWWIAISFVLVQVALGRRLFEPWLASAFGVTHPLTLWLARLTCGFWVTTVALMLLGWLDLLDWPWVALYLIGSAIICLIPVRLEWSSLRDRIVLPLDRRTAVVLLLVCAILAIWLPVIVQSLLPNSDWDGASTHLPLGTRLRTVGLASVPLDHANLIAPGNVHLVYAVFQAVNAEQAIVPLNLIFSILTCLAAAAIASRFWNSTAGMWAFCICLSTNLVVELGLDPRIDGFLGFFCTMTALGIMVWVLERWRTGALLLAGTALGMALGTKYTAIILVLLWGAPILWSLLRRPEARKGQRKWAVAVAVSCMIVPSGYWYASSALRFGDPIYPRLVGDQVELRDGRLVRLTDALEELIGSESSNPEFLRALQQTTATPPDIDPPRTLFNPKSLFVNPGLHTRKVAHTLSPLLLAFFLLPLFHRGRSSWLLLWMGLSAFVVIGARTGLMRYGLPFLPLFAVGAGAAIASFKAAWWRVAWAIALLVVLGANLVAEWNKVQFRSSVSWLRGGQSHVEWLEPIGYNGSRVTSNLLLVMDDLRQKGAFPYDGAALLLGESKTHLFPIEAIPDTSRIGYPWLARLIRNGGDVKAVHRELWTSGVRYVVLNMEYLEWVRNNTRVDQEALVFGLFKLQEFHRAFGQVVIHGSGMYVIRLNPPSDPAAP